MRQGEIERKTKETQVKVRLNLDGNGEAKVATGIPFFDHMLHLLAVHAAMDLEVEAVGDLAVDYHHTVEDVGLVLGDALNAALGERQGLTRYGWALLPMDEVLAAVAVDLGGRPYLACQIGSGRVRDFDIALFVEFFRAMTVRGRLNLHVVLPYGTAAGPGFEPHHVAEAVFKALARALRQAWTRDERVKTVPSTKGVI